MAGVDDRDGPGRAALEPSEEPPDLLERALRGREPDALGPDAGERLEPLEEPAEVIRFANRVPLQYQPKACAISEAVYDTNWKSYELAQPKGSDRKSTRLNSSHRT